MADNVDVTPGAGKTVHADEYTHSTLGSGITQLVKLVDGTLDASTAIKAGATTSGNALAVVGPNDEFVTLSLDVVRPANTTTYTINDQLSSNSGASAPMQFTGAAKASGGSGLITDIEIYSDNDPALPLQVELFFFNSSITVASDNAAFSISDADMKKCIGRAEMFLEDIGNGDYFHYKGPPIGFTCSGSADLYATGRVKNAYIPASGETITIVLKIQRLT